MGFPACTPKFGVEGDPAISARTPRFGAPQTTKQNAARTEEAVVAREVRAFRGKEHRCDWLQDLLLYNVNQRLHSYRVDDEAVVVH